MLELAAAALTFSVIAWISTTPGFVRGETTQCWPLPQRAALVTSIF